MLALALVLALAVGARASCDVCVGGRCHTTQTLIKGFRVTDQLAIDRVHNVLYTQLNGDQNIALFLDRPEIRLLNTMRSSGMAVDPRTQTLYLGTKESKQTFYKYDLTKNTTEAVVSVGVKSDLLFYDEDDKLHFIRQHEKRWLNKQLKNYKITDFVVTGTKIFFESNNTIYVYDNDDSSGQTTPKIIDEKKHVLSSDSFGFVYLGDATQKVIYKYTHGHSGNPDDLDSMEIFASYKYGAVEQLVFDGSGNIVFRDADGSVARWVPAPDTFRSRSQPPAPPLCRIYPPYQDHLIQEISPAICQLCHPDANQAFA